MLVKSKDKQIKSLESKHDTKMCHRQIAIYHNFPTISSTLTKVSYFGEFKEFVKVDFSSCFRNNYLQKLIIVCIL